MVTEWLKLYHLIIFKIKSLLFVMSVEKDCISADLQIKPLEKQTVFRVNAGHNVQLQLIIL